MAIYSCAMRAVVLYQADGKRSTQNIQRPSPQYLEYERVAQAELFRAKELVKKGLYDDAASVLRPAIDRYGWGTVGPYLRNELSEIRLRQGRYQEAYDLITKKGAEYSDGRRYARIAFLKAQLGDYQGSKAMWDEAGPVSYIKDSFVDDWPNVYDINGLKMAWLLVIGDLAGVDDKLGEEFYFNLAKPHDEDNPILNDHLGGIAFGKKNFRLAEELFRRAEHFARTIWLRENSGRKAILASQWREFIEKKKGG
jgi:tetratricopeptide (TPR) repeat protein